MMPTRTRTRASSVSSAVPSRQLPRCAPGSPAQRPRRVRRARPRPRGPRGARCQGSTPPRGRRDPGRGLPTAPPAASWWWWGRCAGGGGGARAAAPLKFESRYQQVRSSRDTGSSGQNVFSRRWKAGGGDAGLGASPPPAGPAAEARSRRGATAGRLWPGRAMVETLRCSWGSKLFIMCVYTCG